MCGPGLWPFLLWFLVHCASVFGDITQASLAEPLDLNLICLFNNGTFFNFFFLELTVENSFLFLLYWWFLLSVFVLIAEWIWWSAIYNVDINVRNVTLNLQNWNNVVDFFQLLCVGKCYTESLGWPNELGASLFMLKRIRPTPFLVAFLWNFIWSECNILALVHCLTNPSYLPPWDLYTCWMNCGSSCKTYISVSCIHMMRLIVWLNLFHAFAMFCTLCLVLANPVCPISSFWKV